MVLSCSWKHHTHGHMAEYPWFLFATKDRDGTGQTKSPVGSQLACLWDSGISLIMLFSSEGDEEWGRGGLVTVPE